MNKIFLTFFLTFFFFNIIFAAPETKNDLTQSPTIFYNYDLSNQDYSLNLKNGGSDFSSFFKHYDTGFSLPWLSNSNSCEIQNLNFDDNFFKASFSGNFNPILFPLIGNISLVNSEVIEKSLYMKTFVILRAEDSDGDFQYFLPDESEIIGTYTYNSQDYNQLTGTTINQLSSLPSLNNWDEISLILNNEDKVPYIYAKPQNEDVSFSQAKLNICPGEVCPYKFTVIAVPIDGKCDFTGDGNLVGDESVPSIKEISPTEINLDLSYNSNIGSIKINNGLEYIDVNSPGGISSGFTLTSSGYNKTFFKGDTINLSISVSQGYYINSSSCYNFEKFEARGIQNCNFQLNETNKNQIFTFALRDSDFDNVPDFLDECVGEKGKPELVGCIDVISVPNELIRYNQIGICGGQLITFFNDPQKLSCHPTFTKSIKFFQEIKLINNGDFNSSIYTGNNPFGVPYRDISINAFLEPKTQNYYSGDYICNTQTNEYNGHCRLSAKINYSEHSFYDQYRDLEIRKREVSGSNRTYLVPFDSPVKHGDSVIVAIENDTLLFEDQNGVLSEINFNYEFSNLMKIQRQGETDFKEITPNSIGVALSNLEFFGSANDLKSRIDDIVVTMKDLDISQTVESQISKNFLTSRKQIDTSIITLNISNISNSKNRISVYYIIPKESAQEYSQINFISEPSNAQRFVSDKDPIIGWYFEDPSDEEVIVIEVPGDSSGGEVIISEDPVLYNSGNLVVRYRESACAADEQLLFELDNFLNSSVYEAGDDKQFKVCLAHLIDDLSIAGTNTIDLFTLLVNNNVSKNRLGTLIQASENTGKYWQTLIQRENPGNYSCVGSFNNLENSKFGDCNYNENLRLWLKLGEDSTPPTINTSYPTLGNAIQLEILINDMESGVNWTTAKYCIDTSNTCPLLASYSQGQKLFISCPGAVGCIKYIRVEVSDNHGNVNFYSNQLRLLDVGSSCQQDCTAKPSPNRYLAECAGLNGCFYYQYDINGLFDSGNYIANQCDFNIVGAWVEYNTTHDIQCPQGPFRATRYIQEDVDILSNTCRLVKTTEYPIMLNGEAIIMNVVSCIE